MDADDTGAPGGDLSDVEDINEDLNELEEQAEAIETGVEEESGQVTKDSRARKYLTQHHPECRIDYIEDVAKKIPLAAYPPVAGRDPNHKSVPYLTQFEKTKLIGFRSNQLAQGARPLIQVPAHVTDVIEIARLELEQRRLPYLLKRPMPDGTYEYWRLADLIVL